MKIILKCLCAAILGGDVAPANAPAQTDGQAMLEATLLDYNGSGTSHYTVAWVVTTEAGILSTLVPTAKIITP